MGFEIKPKTKEQRKAEDMTAQLRDLEEENARLRKENARAQSVIDYAVMMGDITDPEEGDDDE